MFNGFKLWMEEASRSFWNLPHLGQEVDRFLQEKANISHKVIGRNDRLLFYIDGLDDSLVTTGLSAIRYILGEWDVEFYELGKQIENDINFYSFRVEPLIEDRFKN